MATSFDALHHGPDASEEFIKLVFWQNSSFVSYLLFSFFCSSDSTLPYLFAYPIELTSHCLPRCRFLTVDRPRAHGYVLPPARALFGVFASDTVCVPNNEELPMSCPLISICHFYLPISTCCLLLLVLLPPAILIGSSFRPLFCWSHPACSPQIVSVSFFAGGVLHDVCSSCSRFLLRSLLATLRSRKFEEFERSVSTWERQRSFLCDFLVLELLKVNVGG